MTKLLLLVLTSLLIFAPAVSTAQEKIGTLSVSDLYLEPRFLYQEGESGGFSAGNSLVSFSWIRDEVISATVTAGTRELVNRPRRFIVESEDELTLAEAYIEARSTLGTFRFGRVPIPFGTEGGRAESNLKFRRSLLFRDGWIGLRDQGLSYTIEHRNFFNEWAIHNGESGEDLDNQTWFTGRWGWTNDKIYTGFSGSTGRTTPASTQDVTGSRTFADAGLNPDISSRLRFANVFFEWDYKVFSFEIEGTMGDVRQASQSATLTAAHADFQYRIKKNFSVLGRYDILEPSNKVAEDKIEESTFGLAYRGWYETSTLYLFASRVREQGNDDSNHQVLLIWRLSPLATSR